MPKERKSSGCKGGSGSIPAFLNAFFSPRVLGGWDRLNFYYRSVKWQYTQIENIIIIITFDAPTGGDKKL